MCTEQQMQLKYRHFPLFFPDSCDFSLYLKIEIYLNVNIKYLFTTGHVFKRLQAQHNINIILFFSSTFAKTSKQTIHSYLWWFVCLYDDTKHHLQHLHSITLLPWLSLHLRSEVHSTFSFPLHIYLYMSKYLCCGVKCPVEPVGDVDRHSGPAKLLKCFGIQNQEERTLVLQRIKTQEKGFSIFSFGFRIIAKKGHVRCSMNVFKGQSRSVILLPLQNEKRQR